MRWFDEVLSEQSPALPDAILTLLARNLEWRHRRVETITLLSSTFARRRVSLDFTVPRELHDQLRLPVDPAAGEDDQWVVPLAWFARRQLVNFDLLDRDGKAIPCLLGDQTAAVTRDMLILTGMEGGLGEDHPQLDEAVAVIREAAGSAKPENPAELARRAAALGLGAEFEALVSASAQSFLLLALVKNPRGRQIAKWQSDERLPAGRHTIRPYVSINEAASTHLELEIPDLLRAGPFTLWDDIRTRRRGPARDGRSLAAALRQRSDSAERPRLLIAPYEGAVRPYARADLLIGRGEFVLPAVFLAFFSFLLLLVGVATDIAEAVTDDEVKTASVSATVLLSTFAALSGLVLRVETHPLVRALLEGPRGALAVSAGGLVLAAAPIGLQLGHTAITVCWGLGMLLCLWAFGSLVDTMCMRSTVRRHREVQESIRNDD